jgi:hypothetical protein
MSAKVLTLVQWVHKSNVTKLCHIVLRKVEHAFNKNQKNVFFNKLGNKLYDFIAFTCTLTFQFQALKLQHVTNNEMLLSTIMQSLSPCSKTYKAYTLKHLILI